MQCDCGEMGCDSLIGHRIAYEQSVANHLARIQAMENYLHEDLKPTMKSLVTRAAYITGAIAVTVQLIGVALSLFAIIYK